MSVAVLAPESVPPLASGAPPFDQKYPSGAVPLAATVNVAVFPALTVAAAGWLVMAGATGPVEAPMVMVMFWASWALPGLTIHTAVG